MAGLEVVVRPVVLPNIRPAPARSLPPQDDPDKGFAVIRGNGAKQVSLTNSSSASASVNKRQEIRRRVDEVRVYQEEDNGNINKKNFIDTEVTNKMWTKGSPKNFVGFNGDDHVSTVPGRGFTGDDLVPQSKGGKMPDVDIAWYSKRVLEAKNIKIKKRNKIIEADQ